LTLAVSAETEDAVDKLIKCLWDASMEEKSKYKLDEGVLWVVNSDGCRHNCFMCIFADPDKFLYPEILFCCDVCIARRVEEREMPYPEPIHGIPFEISIGFQRRGLKPPTTIPKSQKSSKNTILGPTINQERSDILLKDIDEWRQATASSITQRSVIHYKQFLSDKGMHKVVSRHRYIRTEQDLKKELKSVGYCFPEALLTLHIPKLFDVMQKSMIYSANLEIVKRRKMKEKPKPIEISRTNTQQMAVQRETAVQGKRTFAWLRTDDDMAFTPPPRRSTKNTPQVSSTSQASSTSSSVLSSGRQSRAALCDITESQKKISNINSKRKSK
jgi:hypothetical protein